MWEQVRRHFAWLSFCFTMRVNVTICWLRSSLLLAISVGQRVGPWLLTVFFSMWICEHLLCTHSQLSPTLCFMSGWSQLFCSHVHDVKKNWASLSCPRPVLCCLYQMLPVMFRQLVLRKTSLPLSSAQPYWSIGRFQRPSTRPRPNAAAQDHGTSCLSTGTCMHFHEGRTLRMDLLPIISVFVL